MSPKTKNLKTKQFDHVLIEASRFPPASLSERVSGALDAVNSPVRSLLLW